MDGVCKGAVSSSEADMVGGEERKKVSGVGSFFFCLEKVMRGRVHE